jgi:AraC-like DNA-binding protein
LNTTVALLFLVCLGALLVHLRTLITPKNKNYLPYFIGHIFSNFTFLSIGLLSLSVLPSIPLEFLPLVRCISLLFLYLFIDHLFNEKPSKTRLFLIGLIIINGIPLLLNHAGFRFLDPITRDRSIFFFNTGNILTLFYRDYTVSCVVTYFIIITVILRKFVLGIKNLEAPSPKFRLFKRWFSVYLMTIIFNFIGTCYFWIQPEGDLHIYESNAHNFFKFCELIFIFISPKFLGYLPKLYIPLPGLKNTSAETESIQSLTALMLADNLFLNQEFSLSKLVFHANLSETQIRDILKASEYDNFKSFLNYQRIQYATSEIEAGYLNKHTIYSLSKDSGFNSHQTFYRAFKALKNQTPLAYSLQKGSVASKVSKT